MQRKILERNQHHTLIHDISNNKVILSRDDTQLIKANFKFDITDGSATISHYQLINSKDESLAVELSNMVSNFLAKTKEDVNFKLMCFTPEKFDAAFTTTKEYRTSNIERLMVREVKINPYKDESLPYTIKQLQPDNISNQERKKIIALLQQTYWAENDANETYVQSALDNSYLFAAYQNENMLGIIRFISDGHTAYLSDMVVDEAYRKQGIATFLLAKAFNFIDQSPDHKIAVLFSARIGDGKEAAQKLYGDKFGFVNYDDFHQNSIQFRYVRYAPELKSDLENHSMFSQKETNTPSIAPAPDKYSTCQ